MQERWVLIASYIFSVLVFWPLFVKASKPGWASLVPFYNAYIFVKIAGKPGWWLVLFFLPLVNLVIMMLTNYAFAKSFGQSKAFCWGTVFLTPIFLLILAYGKATYVGPPAPGAA